MRDSGNVQGTFIRMKPQRIASPIRSTFETHLECFGFVKTSRMMLLLAMLVGGFGW